MKLSLKLSYDGKRESFPALLSLPLPLGREGEGERERDEFFRPGPTQRQSDTERPSKGAEN